MKTLSKKLLVFVIVAFCLSHANVLAWDGESTADTLPYTGSVYGDASSAEPTDAIADAADTGSDADPLDLDGDLDGDGIPNWADPDIDGDGVGNHEDADDWDPTNIDILEEIDTDGDGIADTEIIIPHEIADMEPDITVLEVPDLPSEDPYADEPIDANPDNMPIWEPDDPGDNMPIIDPGDLVDPPPAEC
jgi:hypothetical protein